MNRRQYLLSMSAVAAHALFPDVLAAFARASAAADPPTSWTPEAFAPALGPVLADVVETIIPETDTPGAKAARVHVFVDLVAAHCLTPAERQTLSAALEKLGPDFGTAAPAERTARVQAMDPPALAKMKELTVLGYFTSEIGATQALAYDKVPGGYQGCIDLAPGQKAWATR